MRMRHTAYAVIPLPPPRTQDPPRSPRKQGEERKRGRNPVACPPSIPNTHTVSERSRLSQELTDNPQGI